MKIKDGFIIKSVAGSNVIVAVSNPAFSSVITVNETGSFLFEKLKEDTDVNKLTECLLQEYEVDRQTAFDDTCKFINLLRQAELLDE